MSESMAEPMTPRITVRAPAKINLCLGVGPPRKDGFHPLATVYQAVGLYDDVTVSDSDEWSVSLAAEERIDLNDVPLGDRNIAIRAGRLLAEHEELDRPTLIEIHKGIPVAGGMAGGSADAAATLLGLRTLWQTDTSDDDLLALAAEVGSDVPFALIGGTARGVGRGELVEPVTDNGHWWWVSVESDQGLPTPAVYAAFDKLAGTRSAQPEIPDALLSALQRGDLDDLASYLSNDLQAAALSLRPDLAEVLEAGKEAGALAGLVSGSGPTCLFLCESSDAGIRVRQHLIELGHSRVNAAPGPVAGAHVVEYV